MTDFFPDEPGPIIQTNINKMWFALPNDVIGGWSVMNCNKPLSQVDPNKPEWEVASFASEEDAKHIVILHNSWLKGTR